MTIIRKTGSDIFHTRNIFTLTSILSMYIPTLIHIQILPVCISEFPFLRNILHSKMYRFLACGDRQHRYGTHIVEHFHQQIISYSSIT